MIATLSGAVACLGMGCAHEYKAAAVDQPICVSGASAQMAASIRDTVLGPVTEFTWRCENEEIDAKQAAYAATSWLKLMPEAVLGKYSEETHDYEYPQTVTIVCVNPVVLIVAPVSIRTCGASGEPLFNNWRSTHLLPDGSVIVKLPFGVQYGATAPYHPSAVWTIVGATRPQPIGDGCVIHLGGADLSVRRHGDTYEVSCAPHETQK